MVNRFDEEETPQEQADPELLTVREVAKKLRCDLTTVRRWIAQGTLEAVTLPHRGKRKAYRIRQAVLDKLIGE